MRTSEQEPAQPVDGIAVDSAYSRFYDQVAAAQVADWLPTEPAWIVELSDGCGRFTQQLLDAGHTVLQATDRPPTSPPTGPGWRPVVTDPRTLSWLADASVEAVLASSQALSLCLVLTPAMVQRAVARSVPRSPPQTAPGRPDSGPPPAGRRVAPPR